MPDDARTCIPLRPGGPALTRELLELGDARHAQRFLDIGCGLGESVALFNEAYGGTAIGIDIDPARIRQAQAAYPECDYRCASAYSLPFDDASFDIVLAECSLSLFEDASAGIAEIARILAPQGRLLASDVYRRQDITPLCGAGHVREAAHESTAGHVPGAKRKSSDSANAFQGCQTRHFYTLPEYAALLEAGGLSISWHADKTGCLAGMFAQMVFDEGLDAALSATGLDRQSSRDIGYLAIIAKSKAGAS